MSRRDRGRPPDMQIEAMVERIDPQTGELRTEWIPIGRATRTEAGDYIGHLMAEPPEWRFGPDRRMFFRLRRE